jgi:alpha-L-rhamnosidase
MEWKWKWIEPVQEAGITEPSRPPFGGSPEPPGENLARLRPAQYVRKEFVSRGKISSAFAFATSHGLYRLYINGKEADNRLFPPDVTPFNKLLTYQKYDITSCLKEGPNAIGAILTDGWHIGRIGLTGDSCQYADKLAFLFQLVIEYENGTSLVVASDASFKSSTGALDFSDIFIGERYDARKEPKGWAEPGFNDESWQQTIEVDSPEELVEQSTRPVLRHEHFIGKLITTPSGQKVYDMGQVIAGVEKLTARGKSGAEIRLEHSEVLDKDGNFFRNIMGRNKEQTDYYIFVGNGTEVYEPIGTFHGFRYVMAVYDESKIEIDSVEAYAIRTDLKETATFECSDERLNKLWQNTLWSQRGNVVAIPTDCPQRERSGFTGDMQIFIKAACINMDMRNFVRSWLRTVRLEQTEAGEVTIIAPNFPGLEKMQHSMSGTNSSSGWGDAIVIVPWVMYNAYGDKSYLEENYEAMKKWLGFVSHWARSGVPNGTGSEPAREGHKKFLWDTGFHFGDWLVPSKVSGNSSPMTTAELTKGPLGTAYFANSAELISKIARVLGHDDDCDYYAELAQNIREAYTEEYYLGGGELKGDLQGIYVTALAFDLLPESERPAVAKTLVKMIENNGNRLDTGFLSISYLMDVLCDNGYEDVALKLLFQTKCPSWLYEVENGATTVWERWDAITPDGEVTSSSFNHYSFGCVIDWMMRKLAGICPAAPGYESVVIAPMINCGLDFVSASYESVKGRIAVSWCIEEEAVHVKTDIPKGVSAVLEFCGATTVLSSGVVEKVYCLP